MNAWQTVGTIAVVALALGLALVVPAGPQSASVSTTTSESTTTASSSTTSTHSSSTETTTGTSTSGQLSAYASSQHGLQLRLSIDSTTATTGSIAVNVSEYNTLGIVNNVTESSGWQIQAALSSCPNTNVQPFGIAVYQGDYTAQNVSQGTQLQIFPITACPMFVRLVTGYLFQPNSDAATVQPGSGASPTPMASVVTVSGTYAGLDQTRPLSPGVYTIVAADEWGALAFLYLTVQ